MTRTEGEAGQHLPLGASWDGSATTFRIFSSNATSVELVLDDAGGHRLPMERGKDGIWHLRSGLAHPGTRYGFRAYGPWNPDAGHLFNPAKLLLDPYARCIDGPVRWHPSLRLARHAGPHGRLLPDASDSAAHLPRSVVVADDFDWQGDRRPEVPWSDSLIYECHVKGMTALHPMVPAALRGTWLGLAAEPVVEHLQGLGITAVELLPVQPAVDSALLASNGLTNYWGYATIGFFAPDRRFASQPGRERHEFREMVRRLHMAGMEVLLDVVYNHTGEGGVDGPAVSFRGLDNAAYYRLQHDGQRVYEDFTGCGNTLDVRHPIVRRLVLDGLRFWATEMRVDGFRFDLAPVLGRDPVIFDANATLFRELAADPQLRNVKLIAEPWDLGPGGYQLGAFPPGFAEWNGRYRDTVRRFWRGTGGVSDLATRVSGSSDLFSPARLPQSSINFIACHDGFTLQDLVSYERKHNLVNGERNRDGADWNESRNWGIEGPTADPQVLELRARAARGMMATLAFSLGVPMLSQGDEFARTQQGNNNPWCQDSALSWLPWLPSPESSSMLAFTRRVLALRRRYAVFRRSDFLPGHEAINATARWLSGSGAVMSEADWHDRARHSVAVLLDTEVEMVGESSGVAAAGTTRLVLVLNGGASTGQQQLPAGPWRLMLDTARPGIEGDSVTGAVEVRGHSLVLLEAEATSGRRAP
jgi:glycogen operon protein